MLMGKIVTSLVSLIFFMILSSVSLLKVSTPVEMRMMYFFPSTRSRRSSVSYSASNRLVSENPGMFIWFSAPKTEFLSWVKSVRMWGCIS